MVPTMYQNRLPPLLESGLWRWIQMHNENKEAIGAPADQMRDNHGYGIKGS